MTAIWRNDGRDWTLLAPSRFPDEATLHRLIEDAPHLLPLAGSPQLIVVGKEVRLGAGYADLIGVEPDGRLSVIEIKLAKNAEARRAVVAQALSYAAYLYGMDPERLEHDILRPHLLERDCRSLVDRVAAFDQEGEFDPVVFAEGLRDCLQRGHLRVVFVLDEAPPELVQLLGLLEAVSDGLILDLVTISVYDVHGSQILIPQRVEPQKREHGPQTEARPTSNGGVSSEGPGEFVNEIERSDARLRPQLQELVELAQDLARQGFARVTSFRGTSGKMLLLPKLQPQNVGLITIWNDRGAKIQVWRSVFEKNAPNALRQLESYIGPAQVGQGNYLKQFDQRVLELLRCAYAEANGSSQPINGSTFGIDGPVKENGVLTT